MTGMLLISAHILHPFQKLRSFRKLDKGMDINPEDETSYTTQYQKSFLKYVENEYCVKHQRLPVTKPESVPRYNLFSPIMASRSVKSSSDPYDLSSDDEEYWMPKNLAETMPGRSDHSARLLTAGRLDSIAPPELRQNWGQINPNQRAYHSNPTEICCTFWIPDITDWWRQQEETHSNHVDLSSVAPDIFSIIPHGVVVEASFSLRQDVIGWRQSKPTSETVCRKVVVRQFA